MRAHAALAGAVRGALFAPAVAWPVVVVAFGLGLWGRRRVLVVGGCLFVVVAGSSTNSTRSLDFPDAGEFDGWVTLVDDPRRSGPVGIRVTVRADGRRLVATAHGPVAGRLDDALAGDQLHLVGTIRSVSRSDSRSIDRHVVGRIAVDQVLDREGAPPISQFANTIRRGLASGAESLDRADHALFLGMAIGDDRDQIAVTADDFRAAGLGHLLVVSGQNVAFVLAMAIPVAGRLRPAGRALVLFGVLGAFAVLTRFEPSVLRAVAMAGVGRAWSSARRSPRIVLGVGRATRDRPVSGSGGGVPTLRVCDCWNRLVVGAAR